MHLTEIKLLTLFVGQIERVNNLHYFCYQSCVRNIFQIYFVSEDTCLRGCTTLQVIELGDEVPEGY